MPSFEHVYDCNLLNTNSRKMKQSKIVFYNKYKESSKKIESNYQVCDISCFPSTLIKLD